MSKLNIHTINQPESDTTTFVLSCNRLNVLSKTLKSFFDTRDYATKMVIVDDSAVDGVFDQLVHDYGHIADIVCFPRNRSQWWAMDFMVSYCDSEYIFYLEDDWELLRPGYLNRSKQILEKYRDIGVVDTSWRTFELQGIKSYENTLVDDTFYYKIPWRITDNHIAWHAWVGSPNLKRRDDLIMLGRVEKWNNEWNIDRFFSGLGFKGVFLDGEYSRHLGDDCSAMAGKRPDDTKIPYDYLPKDILKNRTLSNFDYKAMDFDPKYDFPGDVTLVTAILDLGRSDRDFEKHYINGLDEILKVRNPLVIFADEKYHKSLYEKRSKYSISTSDNKLKCYSFTVDDLVEQNWFDRIQEIISTPEFINQSDWMKNSVITSRSYIALTLHKMILLNKISLENPLGAFAGSKRFYWIDSGLFESFNISDPISSFDFLKLPRDNFFLTSFPYCTNSEIHGYNIQAMTKIIGRKPNYVCRASLFGGSKEHINQIYNIFIDIVDESLKMGFIGTEESIFTIIHMKYPNLVNLFNMPTGDINNYLNTIRILKG